MSKSVIRLLTCGSVDDGKSTLIGRLLVETDSVPYDILESTKNIRRSGSTIALGEIDFSLLTDGLESERDQGITIDVAYRSLNLIDGKRLIIGDAPGHEQYTRNMAVAASRADIALVIVDAAKGVRKQTFRHLRICSLMGVQRIVVAVNKLDLVDYSQEVFENIVSELSTLFNRLKVADSHFIPISALLGENIVKKSSRLGWYTGKTLLDAIQEWEPPVLGLNNPRMDIQLISRAVDFRGVSGTIHDGVFESGSEIMILPSRQRATISKIITFDGEHVKAGDNDAVTLVLEPDVDASRGDVIVLAGSELELSNRYEATIVWLNDNPLIHSRSYTLISGPTQVPATVSRIKYSIDEISGESRPAKSLKLNEIGVVEIATDRLIGLTSYNESHQYGNFILVDTQNSQTVGAGIVSHSLRRGNNVTLQKFEITKKERALQKFQRARIIWLTGLSGAGKSTIADELAKQLYQNGEHCYVLDGDNLRMGLNYDLGFTPEDRAENVRRVSEVAKLMVDAGLIVIIALVSPYESDRQRARSLVEADEFLEVYVETPIEVCRTRDSKGLYKKADSGVIPNFTGIGQGYEVPLHPDLVLDGTKPIAHSVQKILEKLEVIS